MPNKVEVTFDGNPSSKDKKEAIAHMKRFEQSDLPSIYIEFATRLRSEYPMDIAESIIVNLLCTEGARFEIRRAYLQNNVEFKDLNTPSYRHVILRNFLEAIEGMVENKIKEQINDIFNSQCS